ncbi:MAG: DUF348 domain-containing protein [Eubacterium sp.]|nr:DUF348 domain-containing protein [Eubacterium sp.]
MLSLFSKKGALKLRVSKKAFLKLAFIFVSIFSAFLLTGLVYFRYDVTIIDGGSERTVYTMQADPYDVLAENGISVGMYDRVEFTGFDGSPTATLTVRRAYEVPVTVDGEEYSPVYNIDGTVEQLLEQFSIELGEYDTITPAPEEKIQDGDVIEITRAFDVEVTADGETVAVICNSNTVSELLERAEIKLGKDDIVSAELDEIITEPCEIKVSRVEKKVSTKREVDPYETETVNDNLMAIGDSRVVTEGVDGVKETTTTETYIDGVKTDTAVETKIISEKTNEVIAEGAAVSEPYCKIDDPAIVLENGRPVNYEYIISGPATAYTAFEGAKTASGRLAEIGTCAVNPNVIPYGSLLYIVGQEGDNICYGYAIAADTGYGMMDGTIPVDVYMGDSANHYADACAWGWHLVDIYVIEVGNG